MESKIKRKIENGLLYLHILHHGDHEWFYGSWMLEELASHGYKLSPGTLYPILKSMEEANLIIKEERIVNGKVRKYYQSTEQGLELLNQLRTNLQEILNTVE